jgi:long-chain acyl-CoA synthetase
MDSFRGVLTRSDADSVDRTLARRVRPATEFIVAFWASVSLGAIPAMANAWLVTDELSYCISLADAKVCIIDPERHERLAPRIEELRKGGVNGFVLVRADCDPKGRKASYAGTVLWEDLMKKYESGRGHLAPVDIHPDDSATILFTRLVSVKIWGFFGRL